jgi:hypothetical protein
MKVDLIIKFDKEKEAELTRDLDGAFMSYKLMKILDPSLPDMECVSSEGEEDIEYKFLLEDINYKDLQNIVDRYSPEKEND